MSKGYWIVRIDVTEPAKYDAYLNAVFDGARPQKYGGRFLVRGGSFETAEGAARSRNVLVEFPTYKAAIGLLPFARLPARKAFRRGGADFDLIIAEGYDGPQPG